MLRCSQSMPPSDKFTYLMVVFIFSSGQLELITNKRGKALFQIQAVADIIPTWALLERSNFGRVQFKSGKPTLDSQQILRRTIDYGKTGGTLEINNL